MKPALAGLTAFTSRRALLILSAAFCAAAIALWARSYSVSDHVAYSTVDRRSGVCRLYRLRIDRGLVRFDQWSRVFDTTEGLEGFVHDLPVFEGETIGLSYSQDDPVAYQPADQSLLSRMGFWRDSFEYGPKRVTRIRPTTKPVGQMSVWGGHSCMPLWFLALLFSVAPLRTLELCIRAHRRYAAGCCPTCGYDMRATPNRCPECGRR